MATNETRQFAIGNQETIIAPVHYAPELGPSFVAYAAPCGAVLVHTNPAKVNPSAPTLNRVTCTVCRHAVRAAADDFARMRRRGLIDKNWGR
jgi:hypothetical protein